VIRRIDSTLVGALLATALLYAGVASAQGNAAQVRVEMYQGLRTVEIPKAEYDLVIDVTPLLSGEAPAPGTDLMPLAKDFAEKLGAVLPSGTQPRLHAFHRLGASGGACPEGKGQVAAARLIDEALAKRQAAGASDSRVVVVTDFNDECAVALCASAQRVNQAGGWVDTVQIGPGSAPACLASLAPSSAEPRGLFGTAAPTLPAFRVEQSSIGEGKPSTIAGRGTVQSGAVSVPAGLWSIVVELEPEERIGPVLLQPGERVKVRLMDFPVSAPGRREWTVEGEP